MWSKVFKAQNYDQPTWKHIYLPIYQTKEFDFYRCLEFNDSFYGITASKLFNDNLRPCSGGYSSLFPGKNISYWANSPKTAKAEIKKHGAGPNILTFHAYDDSSSFIPCMGEQEYLIIVDGRKCGIQDLIDKVDNNVPLRKEEKDFMDEILNENFDCIAYDSKAYPGGENYIFLESGFKKLALRELKLSFSKKNGGSSNHIICAYGSDYSPYLESYGEYFLPKCKIGFDNNYLYSDEYISRLEYTKSVSKSKNLMYDT